MNVTATNYDASAVEFIHSSEIIEFFFFFTSFLLVLFTALRIFRYKENFSVEESQNKAVGQQQPFKPAYSDPLQAQNLSDKGSQNLEDKVALDDIHISNPGIEQHHIESPQVILEGTGPAVVPQEKGSLQDFTDNLIFRFMPFLGIAILNIVNFGSYIFLAFMTVFWFLVVFLFNYLQIFQKYGANSIQPIANFFHLVIIFSMFINYFANNQSSI